MDVLHAVHWDNIGTKLLAPTAEQLLEWGHRLVAAELAATGVAGRPVIVPGRATEVLVCHSAYAGLLVLGSHGRNPVAGLLLGSTSEGCARRAHCPVMITHAPEARESDGRVQVVAEGEGT